MFSCIHFPIWPYPTPTPHNENTVFYTAKLYGLTGMNNPNEEEQESKHHST